MTINDLFVSINQVIKYPILKIQNYDLSISSIIIFILIIFLSRFFAKRLGEIIVFTYLEKSKFEIGRQDSILKIINYTVYTFGVIIALQTIGIDLTAIMAGGAILAVGIGFGIQNLITNFVSGILILFEQPIKKDDLIKVDGILGTVEEISIRSTIVKTLDNISIIVPNSKFVTENVENWTYGSKDTRIKISVGVSYSSDVNKVREILLQVAQNDPYVLEKPAPNVQFTEFGDSSLNFLLLVWIHDIQNQFNIRSNLNFNIFNAFAENNIEIPFPQRFTYQGISR